MDGPLPRTLSVIKDGIAQGLHAGAQIYVSLKGRTVIDIGIGEAIPGTPMTARTLNLWFSAGKPIVAIAIGQLLDRQKLQLHDPVERHIPEFGQNGKSGVTIYHLLTHTGGFRANAVDWSRPWEQVIAELCAMPLERDWTPGQKAGYHAASSWFILGEIIRRIDGRDFNTYSQQMIFAPLGITSAWFGMPPAPDAMNLSRMYDTSSSPPDPAKASPSDRSVARHSPGGSLRCRAIDLAHVYEMLLNSGTLSDALILSPETTQLLLARHRTNMYDHTFGRMIDWSLGFLVNSDHYGRPTPYGYGPHASPDTFGHGGIQSASGFADPIHKLAVAWTCNGLPGEARHMERHWLINTAIYEDLGLATHRD